MFVNICMYICMYICTCMYRQNAAAGEWHLKKGFVDESLDVHVYVYLFTFINVYMRMYVHTYTHVHVFKVLQQVNEI